MKHRVVYCCGQI